jgi:flagellar hook protein FlgE
MRHFLSNINRARGGLIMMRSMFSGVSGLRVHQTKMDVIANNIANVNTVGYKSSRVTFAEVFNQTLGGATGPNDALNRGGVNPMQIGLGTNVATIDKLMTTGAAQRTDNPLDLMIQGDGFFVVGDSSGQYFTRSGNFVEDSRGNLSLNGMKLMGWDAVLDQATREYVIDRKAVEPVQISGNKEYLAPVATTSLELSGNINPQDSPIVRSMAFYDSVGMKYMMDVQLQYAGSTGAASQWTVTFPPINDPAAPGNSIYVMYPNGDRTTPIEIDQPPEDGFTIEFDTNGLISVVNGVTVDPANPASAETTITITETAPLSPAAVIGNGSGVLRMGFLPLNQFVNESTNALADNLDGNPPGRLSGISVGGDGKITGRYSNGLVRLLGQVPIANFKNSAGLEKYGDNLFIATQNSGSFDGVGVDGILQGGVLEMSNVDLGTEFTEMITTQRGFQANSRIVSASDQMLQELVNLGR